MHLSVSQWKTDAGWSYRAMQFRIQGFGQSPAVTAAESFESVVALLIVMRS
jgi:hypothetical protein